MGSALEFRLLGPVEAIGAEGAILDLGPPKRRAVFAAIALTPNRVLDTDVLVGRVWDDPPAQARTALHGHISALRRVISGSAVLITRASGYELQTPPTTVDVDAFAGLAAQARHLPERDAVAVLARALALWHGEALAGTAHSMFLDAAAHRLDRGRLSVVEALASTLLAEGRRAEALALLDLHLPDHPLREDLAVLAVRALRAGGHRSAAIEVYRRTERALSADLRVGPCAELQREHDAVLAGPPRPRRRRPT